MGQRLDREIVARALAPSRERAQRLIESGLVTVNGQVETKVSVIVGAEDALEVTGEVHPYVGRGGLKMEAALRHFRVNVTGARCLDVGASTGGFTDCMLQRGAAHVTALDVGKEQLDPTLREDPRVRVMEKVNARYLTPEMFPEPFDMAAIDVSFISLTLILPPVVSVVRTGAHILALIKPEFEAGRDAVGPRGIVRAPEDRRKAIDRVCAAARDDLGLEKRDVFPCPIQTGGNREYWACFRKPALAVEPETDGSEEAP